MCSEPSSACCFFFYELCVHILCLGGWLWLLVKLTRCSGVWSRVSFDMDFNGCETGKGPPERPAAWKLASLALRHSGHSFPQCIYKLCKGFYWNLPPSKIPYSLMTIRCSRNKSEGVAFLIFLTNGSQTHTIASVVGEWSEVIRRLGNYTFQVLSGQL